MRHFPEKDVKKTGLEMILPWLFGFLLCASLIMGHVRLYELRLSNEALQAELEAREESLGALKKQQSALERKLEDEAKAMGYYTPSPEEIVVVHVRGT